VDSGHVDSKKIISIIRSDGCYTLAIHEFIRAIIFGDYEYFAPSKIGVTNLLDIGSNDAREHFLLPILLSYIESHGQVGQMDGYVFRVAIHSYAQTLGYHKTQVDLALSRAADNLWRLIQPAPDESPETSSRYRITTAGAYTYKRLLELFVYIDAMIIDTPITSPEYRAQITDAKLLHERLCRASIFIEYLDQSWSTIPSHVKSQFDWASVSKKLQKEVKNLSLNLTQQYNR